ncbi:MAG: putative PEP-binding protein [Paracoccaceae bacterium]
MSETENIEDIISVSSKCTVDRELYGHRSSAISALSQLGFPIAEGYFISSESIRRIIQGGPPPKFPRKLLDGLPLCLRSSPQNREWRGPESLLYLGLNKSKLGLVKKITGERLSKILYLEHVKNFGVKVMDLDPDLFDEALDLFMSKRNEKIVRDLPLNMIDALTDEFEEFYRSHLGFDFPEDEQQQINYALTALAKKWENPSSKILRLSLGAEANTSTGAILQKMILPNDESQFGLLEIQSIDSSTGEQHTRGNFLHNSFGEKSLLEFKSNSFLELLPKKPRISDIENSIVSKITLKKIDLLDRKVFQELGINFNFSFLIKGQNYFLIDAKEVELHASALLRLNVEGVSKGAISKETAILRTDPEMLLDTIHPQIQKDADIEVIGLGLPASPGAVSGLIAFKAEEAINMSSKGLMAILVRSETSSEDIRGMHASAGVLTLRGGMSSHAAVVARGLGKPCVVGVSDLRMDNNSKSLITRDNENLKSGDLITIDGSNGRVLIGQAQMVQPDLSTYFYQIMGWANELGTISVKANADTPEEAMQAKEFKVDGIGLCRTEHMFFEKNTLQFMQKMILTSDEIQKQRSIESLLPLQQAQFEEILKIMVGFPVTIRLLDLPIHEFLPNSLIELESLADELGITFSKLSERSKHLAEINPMLGKRGVRLGILLPELYKMQVKAILEASRSVYGADQINFPPEIMLPMVSSAKEVYLLKNMIDQVVKEVCQHKVGEVTYKLGVMVETPRAVLKAAELAKVSSFLSFGTNDLTQMTYGLSRDDSGTFMRDYIAHNIFSEDPFRSLDITGVGELLRIASERSRASNPNIRLGICGEHGGDPNSIEFCKEIGLDFVSCSPYRVPMARLGAARPIPC